MSGYSNVGTSAVYEDGDQKNMKNSEVPQPEPYREGKENSHSTLDSKDERSIANKLAAEEKHKDKNNDDVETKMSKEDPTKPAIMHGNEPSKGAKIDAELREEEEAEMKKLGKK